RRGLGSRPELRARGDPGGRRDGARDAAGWDGGRLRVGLRGEDATDAVLLGRRGALDLAALDRDEGRRFPLCRPEPLTRLFGDAGVASVETRAIDVPTVFPDFDDYWSPFLGGQGPAPGYVMSLTEERRVSLRERIRAALPVRADGAIHLIARAWAVRGVR